jgi:transposase
VNMFLESDRLGRDCIGVVPLVDALVDGATTRIERCVVGVVAAVAAGAAPSDGKPAKDHRTVLNAILWRSSTGAPWRDLPERYGPWQTVYSRFRRWQRAGPGSGFWSRSRPKAMRLES